MKSNVLGCDVYNFQITGDVSANLNASSCNSANHAGPTLLILNDQGGCVMDVQTELSATLRAQDHGHPPVVCFEPGIMRRDCSSGNRAYIDICSTLRAQMGDNQPAVCYSTPVCVLNFQGSKSNNVCEEDGKCYSLNAMHGHDVHVVCFQQNQREEVRNMGETSGAITAESGIHNTNYLAYAIDHVVTTGGNCTAQGPCWYENVCPTEKASGVHAVCFQNTGQGYWTQEGVSAPIRTPEGGCSMKANLVMVTDGNEDE